MLVVVIYAEAPHILDDTLEVLVDDLLHQLGIRQHVNLRRAVGLFRLAGVLACAIIGHGLREEVPIFTPGQGVTIVLVGIGVSHDVLLHLEYDLVDQRVVQDEQVEQVLGI